MLRTIKDFQSRVKASIEGTFPSSTEVSRLLRIPGLFNPIRHHMLSGNGPQQSLLILDNCAQALIRTSRLLARLFVAWYKLDCFAIASRFTTRSTIWAGARYAFRAAATALAFQTRDRVLIIPQIRDLCRRTFVNKACGVGDLLALVHLLTSRCLRRSNW